MVVRGVNKQPDKTRKKVGLISPNEERINEEEFPLVYPEEVSTLTTSLRIGKVDAENIERILTPPMIENTAKALASAGADIIFQMGTPLIAFKGYGIDKVLMERVQKASNLPV